MYLKIMLALKSGVDLRFDVKGGPGQSPSGGARGEAHRSSWILEIV